MKKLLLIASVASGLALVPVQRSDAQLTRGGASFVHARFLALRIRWQRIEVWKRE